MSKDAAKPYKEPAKIEDRPVRMAPEKSVKDGMAFFLRQEQEKVIRAGMTDDQKFARQFPDAELEEMQKTLCVSGSLEDIREFARMIWDKTRGPL